MPNYTTPGVYVEEIPTLPPSVAEVATAIPAFIGYTEKGETLVPTRLQTMNEYKLSFGGPPDVVSGAKVAKDADGTITSITSLLASKIPLLYYSLQLYFDNGGGPCYVVSLGKHADDVAIGDDTKGIKGALAALLKEDEPTLIVMPDATRLGDDVFSTVCGAALDHCGGMKDRFAVLDVKKGQKADDFRKVSSDYLSYGAAYTPHLETALAYAYDIVCNGNEIGGGSIRIHRRDIQERVFAVMGLSKEEAQEKFGFLLEAFNYGPPPHGGIAFGWDRICALLSGTDSIRDVIAFPKTGGGVDPLTDAPAPITAEQRKEAGVDVLSEV
jgi:hypothetical protein